MPKRYLQTKLSFSSSGSKHSTGKRACPMNLNSDDSFKHRDTTCPSHSAVGRQHEKSTMDEGARASLEKVTSDMDIEYQGTALSELRRAPMCFNVSLQPLTPSATHKVLFSVPRGGWSGKLLPPFPNLYTDRWDEHHVYMPCSPHNVIPGESGSVESRWRIIEQVLRQPITGVFELEEAILSYNQQYAKRWSFGALRDFLMQDKERKDKFFTHTLPFIQKLVLMLPSLVTQAVPILKQGSVMKLTLSQQQVACLLANAFFCTFPKRNARMRHSLLTDINFSNLYSGQSGDSSRKAEKLRCIINYFERVSKKMPVGTITFTRQVLSGDKVPEWNRCGVKFKDMYVSAEGNIEDDGTGMLQVDFANKYIGGGVLGHGLVQEEIRFVLCPEMIVSRLFTQVLQDNEVLIMKGCERFNSYSGYSNTFQFTGDYVDETLRDSWGRMHTEVVAMDAVHFRNHESQFEEHQVLRELNKAYCAFRGCEFKSDLPAVCTGNWGCGAFRGDKHLKALIQLMAASVAGRQVYYLTFNDLDLCYQLQWVHRLLCKHNLTVKEIYKHIKDFNTRERRRSRPGETLFEFVSSAVGEPIPSVGNKSPQHLYTDEDFGSQESLEEDFD